MPEPKDGLEEETREQEEQQEEEQTEEQEEKTEETEESEEQEETSEELDPNVYDEDGVPWKNKAKENERKYIKSIEDQQPAPASPPESKQVPFEEMELTPTILATFKKADWEEICEANGYEEDTPQARNAVTKIHNANARSLRAEKRVDALESSGVSNSALAGVDPEILEDVEAKLELMNPDKSDPKKYREAVNIAVAAINHEKGTDYKAIETKVRKKIEQDKKIKATQPVIKTTSKQTEKTYKLSEHQQNMAKRYKMTEEDYYKNLPARARIG